MKKILLPLAAFALLSACTTIPAGNTDTDASSSSSTASSASTSSASGTGSSALTFEDVARQYSIEYSPDFTVIANDNLVTDDFSVTGTSFSFPPSYSSGNTLSEAKVNVAVQPSCPASETGVAKTSVTINGVTYDIQEWSGVGAGNLFEGTTYSTMHDNACYLMTLYMHSCNLGQDCYAGHTNPFNRQPLRDMFQSMVRTFKFL